MPKGQFLDLHRHLPSTIFVIILAIVISAFAGVFVYSMTRLDGLSELGLATRVLLWHGVRCSDGTIDPARPFGEGTVHFKRAMPS